MNEFELIAQYFEPLCPHGLDNDAAVLDIPEAHELVVTSDTLNEGTHFWPDEDPATIAHKALRVNLSDLASMGADPLSYQLNIAVPHKTPPEWFEAFTAALAKDQEEFGIFCSGGDTTTVVGLTSISITALGTVPKGQALSRSGAKAGDKAVLCGVIGDAWLGLEIRRGHIEIEAPGRFLEACCKPFPHVALGQIARNHAGAAIDISDGFIADLRHICQASNLGAAIQAYDVLDKETIGLNPINLLTGGDDYALLMAVPPENIDAFEKEAKKINADLRVVGEYTDSKEIKILDEQGQALQFDQTGWTHF